MKKALFTAILGVFLIATPVYAQTITSTPTIEEQYISALTAVLTLLQQQVVSLEQQLADVQQTQVTQQAQTNTIATQVSQIAQNTTPMQTPAVFGSTDSVPAPAPVDKKITFFWFVLPISTNGPWTIHARYTENGDAIPTTITVSSDDGSLNDTQKTRCVYGVSGIFPDPETCYISESYVPDDLSSVITASANGITATTSIAEYEK